MSVLLFVAGVAVGVAGMALAARRGVTVPNEDALIEFSNTLDAIERDLWKQAGVGLGYEIDYGTGHTSVTVRVPNCGEDVVFTVERPVVERKKRSITDTLGITKELPGMGGQPKGGQG
jgi:hypothetical protein